MLHERARHEPGGDSRHKETKMACQPKKPSNPKTAKSEQPKKPVTAMPPRAQSPCCGGAPAPEKKSPKPEEDPSCGC